MLAYDVAGNGLVLVLLHSTVADRRMWNTQWPVLADAGFRVVRCDFRGFGETPASTGPWDNADDVLAVLGGLGAGKVALVGASYGGKVALEIATRYPERVMALALICAGMPGHEPTEALRDFWQREEALLEAGDVAGATELNVATFLGPEASEATREQVRLMQRHAFQVQLPAARWTELPWAGHLPTLERPDELSALLAAFFAETIGPKTGRPGLTS